LKNLVISGGFKILGRCPVLVDPYIADYNSF
jgi:hypothetical protein